MKNVFAATMHVNSEPDTSWDVDDIIREVSTREIVSWDDTEPFDNTSAYIDYYRRDYTA